ncbi:MAG: hypothetical protein K0U66_03195 [Gammaproteobacteria bacterium]|nr:hypothetical protein [Gammaproteobacteria bacterium]
MHPPRPLALCAILSALSFAPSAFAVEVAETIELPANGYTYSTHEFPNAANAQRFVCRIFLDGELLVELSQSICYSVDIVDVSEDYMIIVPTYAEFHVSEGDSSIFAFNKKRNIVTDVLEAINFYRAGTDEGTIYVVGDFNTHNLPERNLVPFMSKAYVLLDGRFEETNPSRYVEGWAVSALQTAWYITENTAKEYYACINKHRADPSDSRNQPIKPVPIEPSSCGRWYRSSNQQLREIISYIDLRIGASQPDDRRPPEKRILDWIYDETPSWYTSSYGDLMPRRKHFADEMRSQTDSLIATSDLTWLYKQGRYHVMDKLDLLWSSDPEPPDSHFSIASAPGGRLLLVLVQLNQPPQPGNTVIWLWNQKKRAVTNMLRLSAVTNIIRSGETLTVVEGYNKSGLEDADPPLWPRLHTLANDLWLEDDIETYSGDKWYNQISSADLQARHFVTRIHLECRGEMASCKHRDDFFKAMEYIDILNKIYWSR